MPSRSLKEPLAKSWNIAPSQMVAATATMVVTTTTPRHFFKFLTMEIIQKPKIFKILMQA
jgi:hypothetical protein